MKHCYRITQNKTEHHVKYITSPWSPWHGKSSGCEWNRETSDGRGGRRRCEYIKQAVTDRQKEVVLQHGSWAGNSNFLPQKYSVEILYSVSDLKVLDGNESLNSLNVVEFWIYKQLTASKEGPYSMWLIICYSRSHNGWKDITNAMSNYITPLTENTVLCSFLNS